ncbi:MAG: hypothetical protein ACRCVX_02210 [Shewanella sp.]
MNKAKPAFIKLDVNVRYWDDAEVNGQSSEDGSLVPLKEGDAWRPVINLEAGEILNWPQGTEASFHFKVCDAGSYYLLDENMEQIASIEQNYVPDGLCHGDVGYGDYIIFNVGADGKIVGYICWIDLDEWDFS